MNKTMIPIEERHAGPVRRASIQALRKAAGRPERPLDAERDEIAEEAARLRRLHRVRPSRLSRLPDLAPADEVQATTRPTVIGIDLESTAVQHEETTFFRRPEVQSPVARLTVYVLNAILLIISFPIGFGMLVFNILGGENLRTTSHVIALTGLAIALTGGAVGSQFLYGI